MESLNYLNRNVVLTPELKKYGEIYSEFEALYFDKEAKIIDFNGDRTITVPDLLDDGSVNDVECLFKECAVKVLEDLESYGIYDVTLKSLTKDLEYYKQFTSLCGQLSTRWNKIISSLETDKGNQITKFAENSLNNVTGLRWGIVTKSISTMVIYDLLDSITASSQKQYADGKIKEKTAQLNAKYGNLAYEKSTDLLKTFFYPNALKIIKDYIHELRTLYMNILEKRGISSFTQLKINEQYSQEILENLPYIKDKDKILQLSFDAFPFNINLYQTLASMNLMNEDLTEFITEFNLDQSLKTSCYNHIFKTALTENSVQNIVDFYLKRYSDNQDKIKFLTTTVYVRIVLFYKNISKVFDEEQYTTSWIFNTIGPDKINEVKKTEISEFCSNYIESVKNADNYSDFCQVIPFDAESYLPDSLKTAGTDLKTWNEYNDFINRNLSKLIWGVVFEYQIGGGTSNKFDFDLLQAKSRSELSKFKGVSLNQSEENTAKANVKTEPKKPEAKKVEKKPEKKNPWFR
jgi:hypothetical protein